MYIKISRVSEDGLEKSCYWFQVSVSGDKLRVVLDIYSQWRRESKRHRRWELMLGKYDRFQRFAERADKPVVPQDVIDEALAFVRSNTIYLH